MRTLAKSTALTLSFAALFVALKIPADTDLLGVLFVSGLLLFWLPRRLRREY